MKRLTVLLLSGVGVGALPACDNVNRSLVFFTNTTVGVDVGVDPTASSGKIIIGYKRAEGVINPVYQPPVSKKYQSAGNVGGSSSTTEFHKVANPDEVYRKEAYSVLAKIAGEAGGRGTSGPNASVDAAGKVAQWFATGKAADYLAKNEYAAAALTGSNEVAKAISDGPRLGSALQGPWDLRALGQLGKVETDLTAAAGSSSSIADIMAELDDAAEDLAETLGELQYFEWDSVRNRSTLQPKTWPAERIAPDSGWFREVLLLANAPEQSISKLEQLRGSETLKLQGQSPRIVVETDQNGAFVRLSINEDADAAIGEAIAMQQLMRDRIAKAITSDEDLLAAMRKAFDAWSNLYFEE